MNKRKTETDMKDSSLLRLLGSLSPRQMKDLDAFLQSPYHNTIQSIHKLFRYIKRYHPEFDSPKLSREHAFFHLFPDSAFNDTAIRKQMSLLKSAVEEFITVDKLKKDQNVQQRFLIEHYYGLEDYEAFSNRIAQAMNKLLSETHRDAQHHLEMLWLYEALYYHPKKKESQSFKSGTALRNLMEHLDLYYMLSKLRLETDLNIRKRVISEEIPTPLPFKKIEKIFNIPKGYSFPADIYLQLYFFQENRGQADMEEFSQLIDAFQQHQEQLGKVERGFVFNTMLNIAIAEQNTGNQEFTKLAARLFILAEAQDLILNEGQVYISFFLNAAILSSGAGELSWVERFITEYGKYLPEKEQHKAISLSWAAWHYQHSKIPGLDPSKKEFHLGEALQYLIHIPYSDFVFDIRIRSFQLRIYYDLYLPAGKKNVFSDYARSFTKYLKENTNTFDELAPAYLQFIKYARELAQIYTKKQEGRIYQPALQRLYQKIRKDQKVMLKNWLTKAVGELQ